MASFHLPHRILHSKKVAAGVQAKAAAVQAYWKSIAPVFGDRPEHRAAPARGSAGAYRDSITIADMSGDDGPRERIQAHDWKAKMIEFGNSHMPEYAPLAKVKANFRR